ncbi:prenyl cysteine carboxyl methyltransferas-like protein Ste14 [Polyplosphaeria fusca]|uniref:Protein-S-isoprenylcysteine O-methyltransferase n=1 Tax=Polyplosphaeria fusca TaxID=682080 RepID=A0A9P4R4C0_9PLEO|nr:prenyl cysteine carboxyl methyltransferas-like protein Ste14 [Polyplosphaeria fusca]
MTPPRNGEPTSPRPNISFPINRPAERGQWSPEIDRELREREASNIQFNKAPVVPRAFFPGGDRSLSAIAIRAFLLGGSAVLGFVLSALFAYNNSPLWRPPLFVAILSIFHFLEFWVTAEYNTPTAFVSAFLLTNGSHYRSAHTFAFLEALITSYFFPGWQARLNPPSFVTLGLVMVLVGQTVRSFAMAQAGTNFNHLVQSRKKIDHELVTTGLYGIFRHPSYFGFFWWGLGTQVVLGNCISFVGYAGVLWFFFKTRITHEEKHLVQFFGQDYKDYRARTRVWIPFI